MKFEIQFPENHFEHKKKSEKSSLRIDFPIKVKNERQTRARHNPDRKKDLFLQLVFLVRGSKS